MTITNNENNDYDSKSVTSGLTSFAFIFSIGLGSALRIRRTYEEAFRVVNSWIWFGADSSQTELFLAAFI